MRYYDTFFFWTSVSLDSYKTKDEAFTCISSRKKAKEIGRKPMAFKERLVTVQDFLNLATSGYCFCNLFEYDPSVKVPYKRKNRWIMRSPVDEQGGMKLFMKKNKYFRGTQTIFVDIDFTKYDNVTDYIKVLSIPPTCVYMSYSDKKLKGGRVSRRFRLVYVFDKILDRKEFVGISRLISDIIVRETGEPMDDDCGCRMSQYMNGVWGNPETHMTGAIYSTTDFPGWEAISDHEDVNIEFDDYMTYQMENWSYQDFTHKNSWRGYYYRTEKPEWEDGLYQLTDENYLAIWFPRERVTDGNKRRKKLFWNACLRVLMFPDITPDTLLYNLYIDTARFFDNSDGVITVDCLKRRAKKALTMTREELLEQCKYYIDYWKQNRPEFIVRKGVRTTQGLTQYIKKRIHYKKIDAVYDPSKSLQENINDGIGIPRATLYKYCKERGIPVNPTKGLTTAEKRELKRQEKAEKIELFKALYDPSKTADDNLKSLSNAGVALSRRTLYNYISQYLPNVQDDKQNSVEVDIPRYAIDLSYQVPHFDMPDISKIRPSDEEPDNTNMELPPTNPYWTPPVFDFSVLL
jgi:hypothetical protein